MPIETPAKEDIFAEFQDISVVITNSQECHELSEYLQAPLEIVTNPLAWWWSKRHLYPILSHVALDHVSVPCE